MKSFINFIKPFIIITIFVICWIAGCIFWSKNVDKYDAIMTYVETHDCIVFQEYFWDKDISRHYIMDINDFKQHAKSYSFEEIGEFFKNP